MKQLTKCGMKMETSFSPFFFLIYISFLLSKISRTTCRSCWNTRSRLLYDSQRVASSSKRWIYNTQTVLITPDIMIWKVKIFRIGNILLFFSFLNPIKLCFPTLAFPSKISKRILLCIRKGDEDVEAVMLTIIIILVVVVMTIATFRNAWPASRRTLLARLMML